MRQDLCERVFFLRNLSSNHIRWRILTNIEIGCGFSFALCEPSEKRTHCDGSKQVFSLKVYSLKAKTKPKQCPTMSQRMNVYSQQMTTQQNNFASTPLFVLV